MELANLETHPELRAAVIELMETEFPKGEAQNAALPFEEEFGALLKDTPAAQILFAIETGRPVAALAWRSFELKQGLKLAAVGLVVTAKNQRKQGHSRALLAAAEAAALKDGAAVICLWSDLLDFYTKMGYVLAGSEVSWDLDEDALTEEDIEFLPSTIRPALPSDLPAMLALYAADPLGPRREVSTMERQLRQSDSVALVAENADGKLLAYALAGKGRDLRNIVHEMIGELRVFPDLISKVRAALGANSFTADFDGPVSRLQFPYTHPKLEVLEGFFAEGEQGAVCFAKVLKIEAFISALNLELKAQDFSELQLSYNDEINAWTLRENSQDIFMSPDPGHLLQVFCNPWSLEDLEGLPGRTLKRLTGWRPYPIYFWGPDSV